MKAKALLLALVACADPQHAVSRDPAACASCHLAEFASWRASRHAASFVDGAFHAELEPRRSPWCIACHAPLAEDPTTTRDDDALARIGVGCATCHDGSAPVTSQRCAACHEFSFPRLDERNRVVGTTSHPMQATVTQAAGADCLDCHDPHRIAGSHDAPTRDRALQIEACGEGNALRVSLANVGAAHNVPTGGVDRHLVLRVWRSSTPDRVVEHVFGRHFVNAPDGGRVAVTDTTIPPGETRTATTYLDALGGEVTEPVNAELIYSFAENDRAVLANTEVAATIWRMRAVEIAPCR